MLHYFATYRYVAIAQQFFAAVATANWGAVHNLCWCEEPDEQTLIHWRNLLSIQSDAGDWHFIGEFSAWNGVQLLFKARCPHSDQILILALTLDLSGETPSIQRFCRL